jgi:hypothetical protein
MAGIPGGGVGGVFFLISALLMPAIELLRTIRGESSRARWRVVVRNAAIAAAMLASMAGTHWALKRLDFTTLRDDLFPAVAPLAAAVGLALAVVVATQILRILISPGSIVSGSRQRRH